MHLTLRCGIVGLPNVGKSTLFNALTRSQVSSENYPFCTIEPSTATSIIADVRLKKIADLIAGNPKIIYPTLEITDIAGLVKGASKGEGLGNQFLGQIREVDAIIHVLRCFQDSEITHVHGICDPMQDIEIVQYEFILADLLTVEKSIEKKTRQAKQNPKHYVAILDCLEALKNHLSLSRPAMSCSYHDTDLLKRLLAELHLLSAKKQLYICNVSDTYLESDSSAENHQVQQVIQHAQKENAASLVLSAKIEAEISEIEDDQERQEMLSALSMKRSGLEKLSEKAYQLLNLFHYFTAGPKEVRAWTLPVGSNAREAAGIIHSDFYRGFICAEVYQVSDFIAHQSKQALKEKGLLRTEGQDYIVQDGDVMEFRFNVSKA